MKWNRDEIVKTLEDNYPDNTFVNIAFMNPKSFKKLFDSDNVAFCGEGKKKITIYSSEGIAENYVICTYANTDLNECLVFGSGKVIFPQTGAFMIPLIPEDE